jgi:serine/threonine-protein kinase
MMPCPTCAAEVPGDGRFCSSCGARLDSSPAADTQTSTPSVTEHNREQGAVSSHPSLDRSRFVPGTILDKRYRIVGLLGRGGMGEVYRADDLKLGQPVALKFLSEGLERDEQRLSRFLNEVRTARQVTHSNVCRVFDIDEVDGHHYLSMEYVDGEDLASLLRRIGRLPKNKAMQIGRQLCAGIQAAHQQGILHRDLKPANVMIDGRGQVKITDFGLAGLEQSFVGREIRSGTPAYMSPEQLAGSEVTLRSDIYSLGLVLYELFTGRQVFEATSATELMRLQANSKPTSPSSHVEGFDPTIEKAILRCLEKRAEDRPASATAVAAALPGGDLLAAALAAGETPSPAMVADAGSVGGLRPAVAVSILALTLAALLAIAWAQDRDSLPGRIDAQKPPDVLVADAHEIIRLAGYQAAPADTVIGYAADAEYLQYRDENGITEDVATVEPSPLHFWLRQSPQHLVATPNVNNSPVDWSNPVLGIPGEIRVRLDTRGRLLVFQAVPPVWVDDDTATTQPDWSSLFTSAGLAMDTFEAGEPRWNPPQASDDRAAWEGSYPGSPHLPIRIEAGSYRGRPVYFSIFPSWADTAAGTTPHKTHVWQTIVILSMLFGAGLLARRNLRLGRGDRRGAFRMALGLFVLLLAFWGLSANHIPAAAEIWLVLIPAVGVCLWWSLFLGYVVWVAVEPNVRRLWPELLISWGRLLDGRLRDPMVGRDLAMGALAGVVVWLLGWVGIWATDSIIPIAPLLEFNGTRFGLAMLAHHVYWSVIGPLVFTTVLLLLRIVLRKRWLAGLVWIGFFSFLFGVTGPGLIAPTVALASAGVCLFVLVRFGLLALASLNLFGLSFFTLTLDSSKWYIGQSMVTLSILVGVTVYGFYLSLAGRTVFSEKFFEAGSASGN